MRIPRFPTGRWTVLPRTTGRRVGAAALLVVLVGLSVLMLARPTLFVRAPATSASGAASPGAPGGEAARTAPPVSKEADASIERLLEKQRRFSEAARAAIEGSAAAPGAATPQPGVPSTPAGATGAPGATGPGDAPGAQAAERAARRAREIEAIRRRATDGLASAPPGDTRALMSVVRRLDQDLRSAGLPRVIDLDRMQKVLDTSERMQAVNRELVSEGSKGSGANARRLADLVAEMNRLQAAMPRSVYDEAVLRQAMRGSGS